MFEHLIHASVWAWLAVLAVIAVGVADVWSTRLVLAAGGREKNPIMLRLQKALGSRWPVPKMAVHIAVASFVVLFDEPFVTAIALIAALANGVVVTRNLDAWRRLRARPRERP